MKLVFLGTSELAATSLKAIAESSHTISCVVTQPDRRSGRGRKPAPHPVKAMAESLSLPLLQPDRVNTRDFRSAIREHNPDVLVVAAFGQILKPLILGLPPHGCLNVHASILPKHRGASPINAAILSGDTEVGVSIMKMDEGLDTGPVGLVGRLPAKPEETAGELHDRLAELGAALIVEALDRLAVNDLEFLPQDESQASHAPKLAKSDGLIRLGGSAEQAHRQIRGLTPWPGCYADLDTVAGAKRVILGETLIDCANTKTETPGQILAASGDGILVACGRGVLRIKKLKPAGKRMMTASEFLNGTTIAVGSFLRGSTHE